MLIDQDKWNKIIKAAEAEMATWNESAKKHGIQDRNVFSVSTQESGGYFFLVTRHRTISKYDPSGHSDDCNVAARELTTGQVRPAKIKRVKGRSVFSVKGQDPKAWKTLADKPADVIVKKLGLSNFILVIGVTTTGSTEEPAPNEAA